MELTNKLAEINSVFMMYKLNIMASLDKGRSNNNKKMNSEPLK